MAFSHSALTVKTNGQTVAVTAYRAGSTSRTVPLHLTSAVASAVTQPYTITSDTTFYVPDDHAGFWVVSVKQPDGTELWGQEEHIGSGEKVIAPLPSAAQVAVDATRHFGPPLPTGALAETAPRNVGANGSALSTGRMSMVSIWLPAGVTVSSITFVAATTALSGGSNQWFALYNADRVLLRQTVDDTSTAWSSLSKKTLALTSTFTTTYSGCYYLAINVTATTVPSLVVSATHGTLGNIPPIINGTSDTGLTDTAPATAAALTVTTNHPYAYVS